MMEKTGKKHARNSDEGMKNDCNSEWYQRGERAPKFASRKTEDLRTLRAPSVGLYHPWEK